MAPLLPVVFGADFADAKGGFAPAGAWLPMLQVLRVLLNYHAIHHGRTQQIGWAYAIGGVVSVVSVAAFAPAYGLTGAVWAGYVADRDDCFFVRARYASADNLFDEKLRMSLSTPYATPRCCVAPCWLQAGLCFRC
ncbi:MAG: hypothetical protein U1E74_01230 [Paenacidovorax caeni]